MVITGAGPGGAGNVGTGAGRTVATTGGMTTGTTKLAMTWPGFTGWLALLAVTVRGALLMVSVPFTQLLKS